MKKFPLFFIIIQIFSLLIVAQSTCPYSGITVTGPPGLTKPGEPLVFTANLNKTRSLNTAPVNKLEYLWTVSDGKIIEGQGTLRIKVLSDNNRCPSGTATVEIKGLPETCLLAKQSWKSSASVDSNCDSPPPPPPPPPQSPTSRMADSFSDPRIVNESFRNTNRALEKDASAQAYIFKTYKRGTSRTAVSQNLSYAFGTFGKNADRVLIFISLADKDSTESWLVPAGAVPPPGKKQQIEIRSDNLNNQLDKLFPRKKTTSKTKPG